MTEPRSNRAAPRSRVLLAAQILAVAAGLTWIAVGEIDRWTAVENGTGRWGLLLSDWNVDTTLPAVLFALLPIFWFVTVRPAQTPESTATERPRRARDLLTCVALAGLSLLASWMVAERRVGARDQSAFGDLPPAYHDEYSYLFQARTFLAGRTSFPGHPEHPVWFSQSHVLTEPAFASRYFPATGLAIAPFEALGHPVWSHWTCGALVAMLMFFAGKELDGYLTGLLAGLFSAVSPGLSLFSNLLLAHHPTLLGLAVLTCFFLRMMRTHSTLNALAAGTGLAFAMLARPMSAAGFALPFGLWLLVKLARPGDLPDGRKTAWRMSLGVGLPVVAGFGVLLAYNASVTGSALTTPYSLYMQTYTPKHVYGFDNAVRGEGRRLSDVHAKYDDWAENLTTSKALDNVEKRFVASLIWVWGLVPLTMAGLFGAVLVSVPPMNRFWLIPSSIVTMHLAHVPYWYEGIMNWHYIFESALMWLLLLAAASATMLRAWRRSGRRGMQVWWGCVLAAPLLPMFVAGGDLWPEARLTLATREIAFSRLKFRAFDDFLTATVGDEPALVLIRHDPADIHIDYVQNPPQLDGPILRVRMDSGEPSDREMHALRTTFPDRTIWYVDMQSGRRRRL